RPKRQDSHDERQPVTPEGRAMGSHGGPSLLRPELRRAESGSTLTPDGQRERKRRALSQLALHRHPSVMEFDELSSEREPEPGTFDLLVCCPHLAELLEDRFLVLRRDTYTSVGDRDLGYAFVHRSADVDPTTRGRELKGVGQEIQEDLLDLAL